MKKNQFHPRNTSDRETQKLCRTAVSQLSSGVLACCGRALVHRIPARCYRSHTSHRKGHTSLVRHRFSGRSAISRPMGYFGSPEDRRGGVRRPIRIPREPTISASPSVILVEKNQQLLSAFAGRFARQPFLTWRMMVLKKDQARPAEWPHPRQEALVLVRQRFDSRRDQPRGLSPFCVCGEAFLQRAGHSQSAGSPPPAWWLGPRTFPV